MRDLDRLQMKKMLVDFYSKCNKAIGRCWFLKNFYLFWLCWVFIAGCWLSLVELNRGHSLVVMHGLFTVVASLAAEQRLPRACQASVVATLSGLVAPGCVKSSQTSFSPGRSMGRPSVFSSEK